MATAQEDVMKRLQGMKDSRSTVGELARGKNMYPGGNAAQSGPGGPDMGRPPTAVPAAAAQAVMQRTGAQPGLPPQAQAANQAMPQQMNPNLQALQNKVRPQIPPQAQAAKSRKLGDIAKQALQAAAQRKMQRG